MKTIYVWALTAVLMAANANAETFYVSDDTNVVKKFTSAGVGSLVENLNYPNGLVFDTNGNLYIAAGETSTSSAIWKVATNGVMSVYATNGIFYPNQMAFDSVGNLFVANTGGNNILKIGTNGSASIFYSSPDGGIHGLAFDRSGNVYVDNDNDNTIYKFTPEGVGTLFAYTGMDMPLGLAFDSSGNLYAANGANNTIEKFTPEGVGSLFASTGLNGPIGLAFDNEGNLYAANDTDSSSATVEKFTPEGVGSVFIQCSANSMIGPEFIAVYPIPSQVIPTNTSQALTTDSVSVTVYDSIISLATNGSKNYTFTDPNIYQSVTINVTMTPYDASNPSASFWLLDQDLGPYSHLSVDGNEMYSDPVEGVNFSATLVSASSGVRTNTVQFGIAGMGIREPDGVGSFSWVSTNGSASATYTLMDTIEPLDTVSLPLTNYGAQWRVTSGNFQLTDDQGVGLQLNATFNATNVTTFYVATIGDNKIHTFTSASTNVTTFNTNTLNGPGGVALDPSGNVYVAEANTGKIWKYNPTGGNATVYFTLNEGPQGMAFDSSGNLYVAENENSTIEVVGANGTGSVYASGLPGAYGLAFDKSENLYVSSETSSFVKEIPYGGGTPFLFAQTNMANPIGLAFDSSGNLYVGNLGSNIVSKITPEGVVSKFTTNFSKPEGVAFDASGNLYTANNGSGIIGIMPPGGTNTTYFSGLSSPRFLTAGVNLLAPETVVIPNAQETCEGNTVTFNAAALGSPTPSVQWQVSSVDDDFANISDATNTTLTVTAVNPSINYVYRAVFTNANGTNYTPGAILTVDSSTLTITTNTAFAITNSTGNTATGPSGLASYSWTISNGTITSATNIQEITYTAGPYGNVILNLSGTYDTGCTGTGTATVPTGSIVPGYTGLIYISYGGSAIKQFDEGGNNSILASGFNSPTGLAFDAGGNLYVAENGANDIRIISTNNGTSTVFASTGIKEPIGLAFDTSSNLYVANSGSNTVVKITTNGSVSVFVSGVYSPTGLAFDSSGNLYVGESRSNDVLIVTSGGAVSTYATGISTPEGLAFDTSGNLYVGSLNNGSVFKVTTGGSVSSIYSGANGSGISGLAFDDSGNLFAANSGFDQIIKITPADSSSVFYTGGNGPEYIAIAPSTNPSFDTNVAPVVTLNPANETVCEGANASFTVAATGYPTPSIQWQVESSGGSSFTAIPDATNATLEVAATILNVGSQYQAVFTNPGGSPTTTPATLSVVITNAAITTGVTDVFANSTTNTASGPVGMSAYAWTISNGTITSATNLQTITYIAGPYGNVTLGLDTVNNPGCADSGSTNVQIIVATTNNETIYVGENVLEGVIFAVQTNGSSSVFVSSSQLYYPAALAFDAANNLYVANYIGQIDKYAPNGSSSVFFSSNNFTPAGLAFDNSGNLYASDWENNVILKITPAGACSVFTTNGLSTPEGLAFDSSGNLFAANSGNTTIVKFNTNGNGSVFADSGLNTPIGLAFDVVGNLYVANYGNNTIEKFNTNGLGSAFATNGLDRPQFLAFDTSGNLFVGNNGDSTLESFTPNGVATLVANVNDAAGIAISYNPVVTISTNAVPVVTVDPASQTICLGNSVEFTAAAVGYPAPSMQWMGKPNGGLYFTNMIGVTNATLTLTPKSSDNSGQVIVLFTNAGGSVYSAPATLTVVTPPSSPSITASSSVCANSTGNTASGPSGMSAYSWSISGGTINSGAASQTVYFTAGGSGSVTLSLVVDNASDCAATNQSVITIAAVPSATITSSSSATDDSTGNIASAPSGAATYAWTISNGTITSATNIQSITYTAGSSGSIGLTVVASNNSGCSATGTASVTISTNSLSVSATDPQLYSWQTVNSGKYARIYTNDLSRTNGTSITTWTNTSTETIQSIPAYCGVQEVDYTSNFIYMRTSDLADYTMGPWYNDSTRTTLFIAFPTNQHVVFGLPRTSTLTTPPSVKTNAQGGVDIIGYFVNGMAMFDALDGFVWNGSSEESPGVGQWYRLAYVSEYVTFDPGYSHQQNTGEYHNHSDPIALRYELGDNVNFNSATKIYTESTNAPTKHSPIIGWMRDGYPFYGPYGYSNPSNSSSGIRRMVSGYQLRNGQNGSDNLTNVGRATLPAWMLRNNGNTAQAGPTVNTTYPVGRYLQDYSYLGDLTNSATGQPYQMGVDFDLNEFCCRWCVTPDFPTGTYAYFVTIDSNGVPIAPWNMGQYFFGNPTGTKGSNITATVTTNYVGVPYIAPVMGSPSAVGGTVTLTWSATEGGTYKVESSTNFITWTTNSTTVHSVLNSAGYTNTSTASQRFYQVAQIALSNYDADILSTNSGGGGTVNSVAPGGSANPGTTVTVTITLPTTPPNPPANAPITSVTLGGTISGTSISDATSGTVIATFTIPANAATGLQSIVVVFGNSGPTYTLSNSFTIN